MVLLRVYFIFPPKHTETRPNPWGTIFACEVREHGTIS